YADRIADQLPAVPRTDARRVERGGGPVGVEALQAFAVHDAGGDDLAGGQANGGRAGDAQRGAALQSRHGVDRPAQATDPLGPVEAARVAFGIADDRLARVLAEQHRARVLG